MKTFFSLRRGQVMRSRAVVSGEGDETRMTTAQQATNLLPVQVRGIHGIPPQAFTNVTLRTSSKLVRRRCPLDSQLFRTRTSIVWTIPRTRLNSEPPRAGSSWCRRLVELRIRKVRESFSGLVILGQWTTAIRHRHRCLYRSISLVLSWVAVLRCHVMIF